MWRAGGWEFRKDEYSFVLEEMVAVLDGLEIFGGLRDPIFKPRGQWHTS
ncbi:hypothetical protein SAMN04488074_13529 [Lentzea albidocapillata subsp. violacea]|uniref:Uncharacterized protein n=1 Tax=Lentzea albidocapillata subsp. violacea TaxID=128104 RepID=A0A1G9YUI2_9PSEU|nr:hypothetical protein [Lentzea albidocapillata]SDN12201.1 hypothetical protein SAMN04488074_13529 [Lentzea albidocapillata subsp. violacea]